MKRVHVIGRKNHGKTTLVAELVRELTARGLRVGTIKHTHHAHELDAPGKDSHTHRLAGAAVVGILSRSMSAVFWPSTPADGEDARGVERYDEFAKHFAGCDVVIVEGDVHADAPRIEVWRAAVGSEPMALADPAIAAVVTDDNNPSNVATWPRSDRAELARRIQQLLGITGA